MPLRQVGRPPSVPDDVVRDICARRAAGLSLERIANELSDAGVPTGHGAPRWTHRTVRGVLLSRRGAAFTADLS